MSGFRSMFVVGGNNSSNSGASTPMISPLPLPLSIDLPDDVSVAAVASLPEAVAQDPARDERRWRVRRDRRGRCAGRGLGRRRQWRCVGCVEVAAKQYAGAENVEGVLRNAGEIHLFWLPAVTHHRSPEREDAGDLLKQRSLLPQVGQIAGREREVVHVAFRHVAPDRA